MFSGEYLFNILNVLNKTQIQHMTGFVENQGVDPTQMEGIEHPSGVVTRISMLS